MRIPSRPRLVLGCLAAAALAGPALGAELTLPRPSPKATVMQSVGLTDVTVNYSRPGVKGRVIWGELVPYDKVWRTGANEATTVEFSRDVEIQGHKLPAGLYSLHTIPTRGDWTVIFSKKAEQWGSYSYDEAQDALRIQVKPRAIPHVEWMTFLFPSMSPSGDEAELALRWEKLEVPIAFKTFVNDQALASIDAAMAADPDARTMYRAADWLHTAGLRLEQAMKWNEQAVAKEPSYFNQQLQAKLLARQGETARAIAIAEKIVAEAKKTGNPPETAPLERLIAEWKAGRK